MDGVNFVDSPKTAITPAVATTSGTSLTTGAKTPYVVDMTDLLMPYVRAVWKAYGDASASKNITAGAIKTTFCFGR